MRWTIGLLLLLLPLAAAAQIPSQGVEFHASRGLFTETDLGTFFTVGGRDAYSNAQAYFQLGLGYDLGRRWEAAAQFGLGASNINCFSQGSAVAGTCTRPDSFTVSFVDLALTYAIPLRERLFLMPRILAGYTNLDPSPVATRAGGAAVDPNVGAALGIEYATLLQHFSVGADLSFRYVLNAHVPAIALFPRVKYTF